MSTLAPTQDHGPSGLRTFLKAHDVARELQCSEDAARRILEKCGRKLPGVGWRCTLGELLAHYWKQETAPGNPHEYTNDPAQVADQRVREILTWAVHQNLVQIVHPKAA